MIGLAPPLVARMFEMFERQIGIPVDSFAAQHHAPHVAAPALVVLYAIDLSLGLMNRYAPQLNLIAISMSLKGVAAVAVWLVMLGTLVRTLIDQVGALMPTILRQVQSLLG